MSFCGIYTPSLIVITGHYNKDSFIVLCCALSGICYGLSAKRPRQCTSLAKGLSCGFWIMKNYPLVSEIRYGQDMWFCGCFCGPCFDSGVKPPSQGTSLAKGLFWIMKIDRLVSEIISGQYCVFCGSHYFDVIMTTMASQITSLNIVYSTFYSDADQRKHQSTASLAFVWGIHRDRWIPRTKGQLRGKCFHLMTSSCLWPMLWSEGHTTKSVHIRGLGACMWLLNHENRPTGLWDTFSTRFGAFMVLWVRCGALN